MPYFIEDTKVIDIDHHISVKIAELIIENDEY